MKNIFLLFGTISFFFISCNKENENEVLLRIKNNSQQNFIYSATANVRFGSINVGLITDYKAFTNVVAYPAARIVIETDTIYTGQLYCGTPPIPMLSKGKYTLEIFADSNSFTGYNSKFIKD